MTEARHIAIALGVGVLIAHLNYTLGWLDCWREIRRSKKDAAPPATKDETK